MNRARTRLGAAALVIISAARHAASRRDLRRQRRDASYS